MPSDNEIVEAVDRLPDEGRTAIDRHKQSHEIKEALVTYALTPHDKRLPLTDLTVALMDEFDVELSKDQVNYYLERYVVPALYVPPSFVRKGLAESGEDLNTARSKLKVANKMAALFERASLDPDAKPQDVAQLARATIESLSKAEESLERWSVVPKKKTESTRLNVNLDMDEVAKTLDDHEEVPMEKGKDFTRVEG